MMIPIRLGGLPVITLACCSLLAFSKEQHIVVDNGAEIYTATVDDSLLTKDQLRLIPVLSPFIDTSQPNYAYDTGVSSERDQTTSAAVFDKAMLAPKLEACKHGAPNCPPTIVDDAFLRNAKLNIEKGRKQLRSFQNEPLPKALEPVRRFLLNDLTTTLRMEEARYDYITTGDVAPLKVLLDRYCTTGHPSLIRDLEKASDAEIRRELSWHDWYNAVWGCYREKRGKYPMQAWQQFIRQYHIREVVTAKPGE